MTLAAINKLNADETYNKINLTKGSIKKATEHLKWNPEANFLKPMIEKRKVELTQLLERLDYLFEKACYVHKRK